MKTLVCGLTAVAVLAACGAGWVESPAVPPGYTSYYTAKITVIGKGTLVLHVISGQSGAIEQVNVDDKTEVILLGGKTGKLSDLKVGQWIRAYWNPDPKDPKHERVGRIEPTMPWWTAQRLTDLKKDAGSLEIGIMVFVGKIEQHGIEIRSSGPGGMEELHLLGPDRAGAYKHAFAACLTKDEMAKALEYLALDGLLNKAFESDQKDFVPPKPPVTPYMKVSVGGFCAFSPWGADAIKPLQGLKTVVGEKAAQKIDELLAKIKALGPHPETRHDVPQLVEAGTERHEVFFSGHVQGVGFRGTTAGLARKFAVSGFVKNLPDGRVQLVVEGQAKEIKAFLTAVREKMAKNITKAEETTGANLGEFKSFEVR